MRPPSSRRLHTVKEARGHHRAVSPRLWGSHSSVRVGHGLKVRRTPEIKEAPWRNRVLTDARVRV